MSDKPWNPDVERIRKAMMERFSDKLSMEEIAEFAYSVAVECTAPAPQPAELREALREALDLVWKHHEIGFIRRAYEQRTGSCELCRDSRLLAIGKVLEAADAAATPQVTPTNESEARKWCDEHRKHPVIGKAIQGAQSWQPDGLATIVAYIFKQKFEGTSEQASPTPELGTCQDHHATITPSTPHARTPYCCEWHSSAATQERNQIVCRAKSNISGQ